MYDEDRLEQFAGSGGQGRDEPPVESAKSRMRHGPSQHEELLAEQEVFGEDDAWEEETRQDGDYGAKKVDHAPMVSNGALYV